MQADLSMSYHKNVTETKLQRDCASEPPSPRCRSKFPSLKLQSPASRSTVGLVEGAEKQGCVLARKLAASLPLPKYKNSSACSNRTVVGWQNLSAGSTEKMSEPDIERSSFYFGRHLAASVQPSDSFRAGLQRQNPTSAAARDENKRKVRIKYCVFPEKMQHRSSSIQNIHTPWFQI